ncbi:Paired zinc finger protein [Trichinella pseudospiralis]
MDPLYTTDQWLLKFFVHDRKLASCSIVSTFAGKDFYKSRFNFCIHTCLMLLRSLTEFELIQISSSKE